MSDDRPLHSSRTRGSTFLSSPLDDEISPLPEELDDASSHSTSLKKRRTASKGKVSGVLKRATSTPLIRTLAFGEEGRRSPAAKDQRRNKLGYHRTSVACGRCRSRLSTPTFSGKVRYNQSSFQHRTLSAKKDQVSPSPGRPSRKVFKLHTTQERMQLLPGGANASF